jgi:hypothetical protein
MNQLIVIDLPLKKNYLMQDIKLNFSLSGLVRSYSFGSKWDFSVASENTSGYYPAGNSIDLHPYLYAGFNGSSVFRFFSGFINSSKINIGKIDNATLRLHTTTFDSINQSQLGNRMQKLSIHAVEGPNETAGSTWANQPGILFPEHLAEFEFPVKGNRTLEIELDKNTSLDWFTQESDSFWLMVNHTKEDEFDEPLLSIFNSREHNNSNYTPRIILNYTEPIDGYDFGWRLGIANVLPDTWTSLSRTENIELVLNRDEFQKYLRDSEGKYNASVEIPFKFSFDRFVRIDHLELNYSWIMADTDVDGFNDVIDEFPEDPSRWFSGVDSDFDGVPDKIDPNPFNNIDTDTDKLSDDFENVILLTDPNSPDTDADGYSDYTDEMPLEPLGHQDNDRDGIRDFNDPDDDNDGYFDTEDEVQFNPKQWKDTDGDGYGDDPLGIEPDWYISDSRKWNPVQDKSSYQSIKNEEYHFKMKSPDGWTAASNYNDSELGFYYNYKLIFSEPEQYTADAKIELMVIPDNPAWNTKDYIRQQTWQLITTGQNELTGFKIITDPEYYTDDTLWYGEVTVQYIENYQLYQAIWFVAETGHHDYIYVMTLSSREDQFDEYSNYYANVIDSFEITDIDEDDFDVTYIFCMIIVIVIIVALIAFASAKKAEKQSEENLAKGESAKPTPTPKTQTPTNIKSPLMKKKLCQVCSGTGKCTECEGIGTVHQGIFGSNIAACDKCRGMGICQGCRGMS